ncbi:MAG: hypothetical protein RJA56_1157, partial [Pseudomonadota bacterium]
LKGIGPSTAAAIASLCFEERVAILDGNVKRVLTRHQGFAFDLSESKHEKKLWEVADRCLPQSRSDMPTYTQGIMDLGATLCTRAKPLCERCPVQADCVANALGDPTAFPVKTRKIKRSAESLWLLCATTVQGDVWLSQRPPTGIWAGLYCPPVLGDEAHLRERLKGVALSAIDHRPAVSHALTHRELSLHPTVVRGSRLAAMGLGETGLWVALSQLDAVGLPKPIRTWLDGLQPD